MKLNENQVRQGDVMLVRVNDDGAAPRYARRAAAREGGKIVVEHGEATGHGHRIADAHAAGFRAETAEMAALGGVAFVSVGGADASLRHEFVDGRHAEHEPITLRAGGWERAVQVDDDEAGAREVID